MDFVVYLEKYREEKNGSSTSDEVFKVADALMDKQLELFDKANELDRFVSRKDNFFIRTVKDSDLNENTFKRRAQLITATIDVIIEKFEASGNYTNFPSTQMYYRAHVDYGKDESASERRKLRNKLKETGLNGSIGGDIRVHADVGSIGCLELPIEDSVGVTGLTRGGAKPKMQTIPFEFTDENIAYLGDKIEGHGDFWRSIFDKENNEYKFKPTTPISSILNQADLLR